MDRKTIFIISTNRADYGLLQVLIKKINSSNKFNLVVVKLVGSDNYSSDNTINVNWHEEIISYSLSSENSFSSMKGLIEIGNSFKDLIYNFNPKLILILGDRYELLQIVSYAIIAKVPVAHISGGEITLGAIDDKIRNMVSFASEIHFVAHQEAYKRLETILGVHNKDFIHIVGEPGLEEIKKTKLLNIEELSNIYKLNLNEKYIVATLHPETNNSNFFKDANIFFETLLNIDPIYPLLISNGNNDPIGFDLNKLMQNILSKRKNTYICSSFGQINYWSLLSFAHIVIGNSSSGLVEAPFLGSWTIDVGNRQSGRIFGETVKRVKIEENTIKKALLYFLRKERSAVRSSPYGNGDSSLQIFNKIEEFLEKRSS